MQAQRIARQMEPLPESFPLCSTRPMPTLTASQVRFEIIFALRQVEKSTVNAWAGKDRLKRMSASERIADVIAARFEQLEVIGPEPQPNIFADRS
jgi:hypothetical protein